jgi:mevalonate kinase
MKLTFVSQGKLLISGEYLVLEGASALALPTKLGQTMDVELLPGSGNIHWMAKDFQGQLWLNCSFILQDDHFISVAMGTLADSQEVKSLVQLLESALNLNPNYINNQTDYEIACQLQFPRDWGLGSSSTLIANIAKWAQVNPMELFFKSWEGSGYDVALAMESKPIRYELKNQIPTWNIVPFNKPFCDKIHFIHLGNKQNSRNAIAEYKSRPKAKPFQIEAVTSITNQLIATNDFSEFEQLIEQHETVLSEILGVEPIKKRLFSDYEGSVKSLGAWGGDFILATGAKAESYFNSKGYQTIIPFHKMILDQ